MKKKQEYSLINQAALGRLKRYYPYDEENKTFTIIFHYDNVGQFANEYQVTKALKIRHDALVEIEKTLHSIPNGYHTNIEIIIDDYQGREKSEVMQALQDVALERQFIGSQQYKRDSIKAGILVLIGVCWIILSSTGAFLNWWGKETSLTHNIITGFLNVFAVVFIWEAVNTIVIHGNPFIKEFRHLLKKLKYLIVKDKKGEEEKILLTNIGYSFDHYRKRAVSEYLIMFSSFAFFGLVLVKLIRYSGILFVTHENIALYEIVAASILLVTTCILGIFGVLIYRGHLKLLLPSAVLNAFALFTAIANIIFFLHNKEPLEKIVTAVFIMIAVVGFTIGLSIKYYLYNKKKIL